MANWSHLSEISSSLSGEAAWWEWIETEMILNLNAISECRDGSSVLFYGSSFLQKPTSSNTSIRSEDLNGFISVLSDVENQRNLSLILHTPGGGVNATETIVEYLRSRFEYLEVIIPTFSMSAGTMIALSADLILMGTQSQLGPIDPQMQYAGRYISARAVVEQFKSARKEILAEPDTMHVWAPIIASLGPALIEEAHNALDYGEKMVSRWMEQYMFSKRDPSVRQQVSQEIASYFNDATIHKSHGRRIDRQEASQVGVRIFDIEENLQLEEAVNNAYFLITILFEKGKTNKLLWGQNQSWIKE